MRGGRKRTLRLVRAGLLVGSLPAADGVRRNWPFDDEGPGRIAEGFTNEVGEWKVVASDKGRAQAQSAKGANSVYNVTLVSDTHAKDVDLSIRMKGRSPASTTRAGASSGGPRTRRTTTWPAPTRWRTPAASTKSPTTSGCSSGARTSRIGAAGTCFASR